MPRGNQRLLCSAAIALSSSISFLSFSSLNALSLLKWERELIALTLLQWAVFKSKDGGKRFYSPNENGVSLFAFDMLPHFNHIEMAGFEISSIISYNIDKNKRLKLYTFCVFPQIRIIPNETRGSSGYQ